MKESKKQKEDAAYHLAFSQVCCRSKGAPAFLRLAARAAKKILDNTKARYKDGVKSCKRHPLYQAKRKPVNNCITCWRVYNAKHSRGNKA